MQSIEESPQSPQELSNTIEVKEVGIKAWGSSIPKANCFELQDGATKYLVKYAEYRRKSTESSRIIEHYRGPSE